MEHDCQNKPCIIKQGQEYKQQRVAKQERYRIRRKVYKERGKHAVLWETSVEAVITAYHEAGGDSAKKEDELQSRLCWFRKIFLNKIK